jgi:hypothetical protein
MPIDVVSPKKLMQLKKWWSVFSRPNPINSFGDELIFQINDPIKIEP